MRSGRSTIATMCALAIALGSALSAAPAHALRIDWEVETDRTRGARIVGHVHNDDRRGKANLRIRADQLGPDGAVVATYRAWAPGSLTFDQTVYFEVPVPDRNARYRVSVESYDFFGCD